MLPKLVIITGERQELGMQSGKDTDQVVGVVRATLAEQGVDAASPPEDVATANRTDIQAAISRMSVTVGGKRELRKLPEMLQPGETVLEITTGTYGRDEANVGLLVLTERRLLFFFDGLVNKKIEDFPLTVVTSVMASTGLIQGKVRIASGGHQVEIHRCPNVDAKRLAESARTALTDARAQMGQPPPIARAAHAPSPADVPEQLRKLADLRDAGILTPEEFDAKKRELLARM